MTTSYGGKCDNCGKNHPEIYVEIRRDNNNNGSTREYWCLECMRDNSNK